MLFKNHIRKITLAAVLFCFTAKSLWAQSTEAAINKKIETLIKQLTLEEKVKMIHASSSFTSGGVPRLGIPELVTSDGPHGVRLEHGRGWNAEKEYWILVPICQPVYAWPPPGTRNWVMHSAPCWAAKQRTVVKMLFLVLVSTLFVRH